MATSADSATSSATLTGCVKWFDNGLNYGFITVLTEGEHHNADIFVHQSNIKTKRDCYRTLYTGECVQFEMAKSDNEKHPFQAVNVSGYNETLLHCENPNYRPRGNFRKPTGFGGGRGGFRGGRGGYRQSSRSQQQETTSEQVVEPVVSAETTATTSTVPAATAPAATARASAPVNRGRGRGRGKAASN